MTAVETENCLEDGLPAVGDVIEGKYEIRQELGRGGMGVVFAAHHRLLDQTVAIKFLTGDSGADSEAVERFKREARASAKVISDHVPHMYDVDVLPNGARYMVMEHLSGRTLGDMLEQELVLSESAACEIAIQILDALGRAHEVGIVHRDIKPENVFLCEQPDGTTRVKVLDFGISKVTTQEGLQLTGSSDIMGTPFYMSPEQMVRPDQVNPQTDLWSLGVVLYEMISGRLPYEAETLHQLCTLVLGDEPSDLRTVAPQVSPTLAELVMSCLAREPASRPDSAHDMARELFAFVEDPDASLPSFSGRMSTGVRRARSRLPMPSASFATPAAAPTSLPASESSLTLASHSVSSPAPLTQTGSNSRYVYGVALAALFAAGLWGYSTMPPAQVMGTANQGEIGTQEMEQPEDVALPQEIAPAAASEVPSSEASGENPEVGLELPVAKLDAENPNGSPSQTSSSDSKVAKTHAPVDRAVQKPSSSKNKDGEPQSPDDDYALFGGRR